ncbi:aromatic amino acid transaminase [Aquisalinus flavus]|uniref:Aminotransferase n=1 Tax=Aquisalinus flavus TaxID=1526572 RepID=A0A8J2Y4N9_9PROT|nr:aromatic amino acid transaminase [Aquisalinus flavus]MBD0427142.1 aspartate/tyrosine/aromatic aminotransferase [Aquisalinus flavus]UNE46962.1 aspartate/tyrosine/aromatic aminotransferase [Aquisalinus flavus]GGC98682.1 aminotransferase [Aquisalinus flavus]
MIGSQKRGYGDSMFEKLTHYRDDVIESIFRRCAADTRPGAMNLSIGVFRDRHGTAPLMSAVRKAETDIVARQDTKAYVGPLGNAGYARAIEELVLGTDHPVLDSGRLKTAQTPGAGAALRVAAEMIRDLAPGTTIWFSDPVWLHQVDFFTRAGLKVAYHPYYDWQTGTLDFEAMLAGLREAAPGDVLVIHAACHNPTGADLSPGQWRVLTDFCLEQRLLPLVDSAYQGYGDGLDADAAGLRHMAAHMPEMMIAVSSSKSFAVYRDRVGALLLLHPEGGRAAEEAWLHMGDLIRGLYFMPPDLGAAVITRILTDAALKAEWQGELETARTRVKRLRQLTVDHFAETLPGFDSRYMLHQRGMFSCLPVSDQQRLRLERDEAVYLMPSGRLNFAALSEDRIPRLAEALKAIW